MALLDFLKPNFATGSQANIFEKGLANLTSAVGSLATKAYESVKNIFLPTAYAPEIEKFQGPVIKSQPSVSVPQQYAEQVRQQLVPTQPSIYETYGLGGGQIRPALPQTTTAFVGPSQPPPSPQPLSTGGPVKTPEVGKTGTPGATSVPGGGVSSPQVTGTPGITGGGSSFTGTLGAVSGLGATSPLGGVATETEEEKRKREEIQVAAIQRSIPGARLFRDPTGQFFAVDPSGRVLTTQQTAQLAGLTPSSARQDFQAPTTPSFDATGLQTRVNEISKILTSGKSLSAGTLQDYFNELGSIATGIKLELEKQSPLPQFLVVETQDQLNYLNQQPFNQRLTLRQQMDGLRGQLGLPGLEKNRIDLMQQIQATNEAFQKVIDDINENPDLPKGLAKRRVQELQNQLKTRITQLTGQLEITQRQITDANDVLNREFGIAKEERLEEERQRDNARSILNSLISSKGITSLSEGDLTSLASAAGLTTAQARAIQNAVKQGQREYSNFVTKEDAAGNLNVIGIKSDGTSQLLSTIKGVGTPSPSPGRYTSSTIPQSILTDLTSDINTGKYTLSQLYQAYPEVSPELIQSLFYNR